ncbi:aureocin A53 family class IId bacteriocin [Bacillus altitudinis]|nr:aureocin A53 family class IId bacteriocin [Bacillus altitudinis]WQH39172.1 aureocin A53 family class IId bacteriocin [Bacillus altitudinis]
MVAFLRLVAQLGTKAAKWAWANKSTVINCYQLDQERCNVPMVQR